MPVELDYRSPPITPRELLLEETAGGAVLTFPRTPRWVSMGAIITSLTVASAHAMFVALFVHQLMQLPARFRPPIVSEFAKTITIAILMNLFLWIEGLYCLLEHSRWGHLQNRLAVTRSQIVWARRGLWGLRTRTYAAEDVTQVLANPVKDIFGRKKTWTLRFKFRTHRTRRWTIWSRDPNFAERTAAAFRRALGVEETTPACSSVPTPASRPPEARSLDTPAV